MTSARQPREDAPEAGGPEVAAASRPRWQRWPSVPVLLALVLLGYLLVPPVRANARLGYAFAGAAGALLVWSALVWWRAWRSGRALAIEFVPGRKSHYIQGSVQLCVYAYWGWYWRNVYAEAPLILAQLVFLYAFDALLAWTRGRSWRLGFGPLPIVLSTNVFIWFRHDWYAFQFVLLAAAALGKDLVQWEREGRRTHIFNPSAFGLALVSLVLILTGTTRYTWGIEIASTIGRPPHIYLEIFLLGLVVQFFFATTLMTLSAAAVLCLCNSVYQRATGTYFFVDTNLPIAIFLGLHLLVTDPSTSPRTNVGRVIFGGLYGLGNVVLYALLQHYQVPEFYDKLLPVPLLNLSVRWMDRLATSGVLGRWREFESRFRPRSLNLVHMGTWAALFAILLASGYVESPHPGASIAYWKEASEAGRPGARERLLKVAGSQAEAGSPEACNALGEMYMQGALFPRDRVAAAHYFARACELGSREGCQNLAIQFLFLREARSDADVAHALQRLEQEAPDSPDGRSAYLIGFAYETGRGRAVDPSRAGSFYVQGCKRGNPDACKGLARLRFASGPGPADLGDAAHVLEQACAADDAESCLYLAYMLRGGWGIAPDEERARLLLEKACALGSTEACRAHELSASSPPLVPRFGALPGWCRWVRAVVQAAD